MKASIMQVPQTEKQLAHFIIRCTTKKITLEEGWVLLGSQSQGEKGISQGIPAHEMEKCTGKAFAIGQI